MSHRLNISWIAGFIDGDGSFYIQTQKGRYQYPVMTIHLSKWDEDILYRIKDSLGGIGGSVYSTDHTKLRREGINASDQVTYTINNRKDYTILLNALEEEKRNRDWLNYWAGFICAEGCFRIDLSKNVQSKHKYGFQIRPSFSIKQEDKVILEDLQQFMNCGNISKDGNSWHLQVTNLLDCFKVDELFINYIHNVKHHDFLIWRHLLQFITEKRHLTKDGILYVARLKQGMNVSCKCKWTPKKIKEYWNEGDTN